MYAKATVLGRVGKKKVITTHAGQLCATLSVVTFKKVMNKDGKQNEFKDWHTVFCYGKIAEIAEKHIKVGDLIFLEGEIRHQKVSDHNTDKWMYSINVSELRLLPPSIKGQPNDNSTYSREYNY